MCEKLKAVDEAGQTVIVDNTTKAAATLGVARVVHAAPDSYTIGIGHWSTHVVNPAIYALNFDILDDLEPRAYIATNPQLLVTRKIESKLTAMGSDKRTLNVSSYVHQGRAMTRRLGTTAGTVL